MSHNFTPGQQSEDPAASMSLLTQLLYNPLDAGYEAGPETPVSPRIRAAYRILVLVLAVALGIGSVIAVRALQRAGASDVHDDLLERARAELATVTELEEEVTGLAAQIRAKDSTQSAGLPTDPALALATATTQVTGPGLIVTLHDAPGANSTNSPTGGAVRDQDLRMVVNALWASGAEAISVNGNRIAPGTFIRTAGSTVLVNVTATTAPYEVAAIGDANALSTSLVRGSTGDYLSAAESLLGISVRAAASPSVTMEAMDLRTLRYAQSLSESEGN